ncbi:MAG: NUDIX domain-containing protein [bacterium]|nr:NUDIX domain-containing protein [bacterium]
MQRSSRSQKLAPHELSKITELLARVTPVPFMETPVFKTIWKTRLVPMATLELLIFERDPLASPAKTLPRVLLSYRTDEHYDCWHVPGGFLGTNETIAQATKRILKRELGILPKTIQPLLTINRPHGARDHHLSSFVAVTPAKAPRLKKGVLEYFDPSQLPKKIIPYYRNAFSVLAKMPAFWGELSDEQRRTFFEMLNIYDVPHGV